jgi:hypothetical protein
MPFEDLIKLLHWSELMWSCSNRRHQQDIPKSPRHNNWYSGFVFFTVNLFSFPTGACSRFFRVGFSKLLVLCFSSWGVGWGWDYKKTSNETIIKSSSPNLWTFSYHITNGAKIVSLKNSHVQYLLSFKIEYVTFEFFLNFYGPNNFQKYGNINIPHMDVVICLNTFHHKLHREL